LKMPVSDGKQIACTYLAVVIIWLVASIEIALNIYVFHCEIIFDGTNKFIFMMVCEDGYQAGVSPSKIIDYVSIYGVAVLYVFCIYKIWSQRKQIQDQTIQARISGRQKRLAYLSVLIWVPTALSPIGKVCSVPF
jgi:hypothetical protein